MLPVLRPARELATEDGIEAAVDAVSRQWQARISALVSAGWQPSPGKRLQHAVAAVRGCARAFTPPTGLARSCGHRVICPFCYAREVRQIWLGLDARFDTIVNHVLVERELSFEREAKTNELPSLLLSLVSQRSTVIQLVDPLAAALYTTLTPADGAAWRIHHRQLFLLPAGRGLPDQLLAAGSVRRHEQPTRRNLMRAVARLWRYPKRLMTGDPEKTVQLLDARRKVTFRGCAMFRKFRGTTGN